MKSGNDCDQRCNDAARIGGVGDIKFAPFNKAIGIIGPPSFRLDEGTKREQVGITNGRSIERQEVTIVRSPSRGSADSCRS